MTTRVKLKPGQKWTKKLLAQYGEALVCVRYRYDAARRKQIKTVELVVSETDWTPPTAPWCPCVSVLRKKGFRIRQKQREDVGIGNRSFGSFVMVALPEQSWKSL